MLSKRRNPVARWLQPTGIVKHAAFDSKRRLTPRFPWAEANGLQVGSLGLLKELSNGPFVPLISKGSRPGLHLGNCRFWLWIILTIGIIPTSALAQDYTQRGFVETRFTGYPQEATNDRARAVGETLLRYEGFYKPSVKFQLNGTIDLRADTHHQVERKFEVSWSDRELRRPALSIRRLSAIYHSGGLSIEAGKQLIRWGKADILNPTDRFAPRDFLTVLDNDFLGITAARVTYEKGSETIDAVWSPRFTPSRIPLLDQRWFPVPDDLPATLRVREGRAEFPGGPQAGIRWNHVGLLEFSGTFYQGFNHLPSFVPTLTYVQGVVPNSIPGSNPSGRFSIVPVLNRFYPKLTMLGADAAIPLHWFSVKGEAGYFTSRDPRADEYAQYVLQLERHTGEWTFVGGYAGETVTHRSTQTNTFAPDRGLTRTLLGSARLTIDANRSIAIETSVRQNLDGAWARVEYSQTFGQHWRATTNFSLIRGRPADFLGQYRRNSHATIIVRYSF